MRQEHTNWAVRREGTTDECWYLGGAQQNISVMSELIGWPRNRVFGLEKEDEEPDDKCR